MDKFFEIYFLIHIFFGTSFLNSIGCGTTFLFLLINLGQIVIHNIIFYVIHKILYLTGIACGTTYIFHNLIWDNFSY